MKRGLSRRQFLKLTSAGAGALAVPWAFRARHPFPHNGTGQPSDSFPSNRFERFLPLSRVREIAWRVRLFGSANVPGGDFNDAVLGPTQGWRDLSRQGIASPH